VIRPRVISLSPFSRWLPVIRSAPLWGTGSQYPQPDYGPSPRHTRTGSCRAGRWATGVWVSGSV